MIEILKNTIPFFLALFLLVSCQSDTTKNKTDNPTPTPAEVSTPVKEESTKAEEKPAPAITEKESKPKEEAKPQKVAEKEEKAPKPKPKPKKYPKMSFASTSFDYGIIMQGDKVEHEFKFTNKGTANLLITNVSASCGCTQPTYPFIPIKPGEEGKIGVIFDSKGKLGRMLPTITVVTNAKPSTYKLKLTGFVDAEREKEQPKADTTQKSAAETPDPSPEKEDGEGEGLK